MSEPASRQGVERRDYTVASVARALRVVDVVAEAGTDGLTLTELARLSGMSKSAGFAIARTLVDAGYIREVHPGPRYRLGLTLVRLGDRAVETHPLTELVKPVLHDLTRRTQMTARAAINDDGYPMFISRVDAPGVIRFHAPMGVRELPHSSAAGKAILAHLPESEAIRIAEETGLPARTRRTITTVPGFLEDLRRTRERGFGIDDEEDEIGVYCLSAPVFGLHGGVFGALSVTTIKTGSPERRASELGGILRRFAAQITAQIAGRPRGRD
ncbi:MULTISPECIES: IclR family transcriptional regulator [Mycetocola]|uniref:IclR family transcriptional regulator n=1 Tax=Mycetocola lacteus TaxID=76637 RepID=A0A3L7AQW9_9MICO|nr:MULTISPECIES: IclR family transcriptional regulator [Mycetocola]MCS4276917.1 IclR family acetate operon transcriptional repressor [Mycetocola sp. BIGb0189]RLP82856.1 IclR family transcriptional regulator [Mycetocola lacteus]